MTEKITRREIGASVLGAMTVLSGCGGIDYTRARMLELESNGIEITQDGGIDAEIEVHCIVQGTDDGEWGQFHNVRLVAKTADDEVLRRDEIGTMTGGDTAGPFELQFSNPPEVIEIIAREDPCGKDTSIDKYVFIGDETDKAVYEARDRCDE